MHAPRPALLVALAIYAFGAMVLPALRLLARAGTTGVVLGRAPSPIHRFVSAALGSYTMAIVAWAVLYARFGAAPLGVWTTPLASQLMGYVLLVTGFALMVTAQRQMGVSWRVGIDPDRTALVTSGLYGLTRHPIYSAAILAVVGVPCLTPSPWTILGATQTLMLIALQARLEEEHLMRSHGDEYRSYAARVGRFWPVLSRPEDDLS